MRCAFSLLRLRTLVPYQTKPRHFNFPVTRRWFSEKTENKLSSIIDTLYNEDEKQRILEAFNHGSEEELQRLKYLSPSKATHVVKYRTDNGDFVQLSDILNVQGMGLLALQKLCNVLKSMDFETLVHQSSEKQNVDQEKVKTEPYLSGKKAMSVKTLVAIEVHLERITWTKMDRDQSVLEWSSFQIFDRPILKYDPILFLEKMYLAIDSIPDADIYVLERKMYRLMNPKLVPIISNLRILETLLLTLLNNDLNTTGDHRVYFTPTSTVSRFFNLNVGGERVSGQHVIQDILRKQSEIAGHVEIPTLYSTTYSQLKSAQQEAFSNTLLLAIAFFKTVILKADK